MSDTKTDLVSEPCVDMDDRCSDCLEIEAELKAEIERLTLENWQLKGALGYEVPGDIPEGEFKCGLCDARRRELTEG